MLGIAMLLVLILLLMYRNVVFEFTYADGRTKTVKKYRRHRKNGIEANLKSEYFEDATSVRMTLKKRITKKMQSNTVLVSKDGTAVKEVNVPRNARDRFEDMIV